MTKSHSNPGLTRMQLVQATGCMPFHVDYYRSCGYLPILRKSSGPGHPFIYNAESIQIIKDRMAKHTHPDEQLNREL